MIQMKKGVFTIFLAIILTTICIAQTTTTTTTMLPDPAQEITNRINEVVCTLVQFLSYAAIGIASLAIIFAGLRYTASAEDPGARNNAKNTIIYAVLGIMIVLVACPVVDYIIANTEITPFEDSCTCLISMGNSSGGGNGGGTATTTTNGGGGGGMITTTSTQPPQYCGECQTAEEQDMCDGTNIVGYPCCETCGFCCNT